MSSDSPTKLRDRPATEAGIVAAAERLLLAQGWTGLNVQTLAAEAGVDRKLIYRYFEGVEGVVERLAGRLDLWLGQDPGGRAPLVGHQLPSVRARDPDGLPAGPSRQSPDPAPAGVGAGSGHAAAAQDGAGPVRASCRPGFATAGLC